MCGECVDRAVHVRHVLAVATVVTVADVQFVVVVVWGQMGMIVVVGDVVNGYGNNAMFFSTHRVLLVILPCPHTDCNGRCRPNNSSLL